MRISVVWSLGFRFEVAGFRGVATCCCNGFHVTADVGADKRGLGLLFGVDWGTPGMEKEVEENNKIVGSF